MIDLKTKIRQMWRQIDIRHEQWKLIVNHFGTAYKNAYKTHVGYLPRKMPSDDGIKSAFTAFAAVVTGALTPAAAPWIWPVMMRPISDGIGQLGDWAAAPPEDRAIRTPGVSAHPDDYAPRYIHAIGVFFVELRIYVDRILKKLDGATPAVQISSEQAAQVDRVVAQSPFWHVPKNWRRWEADIVADEIEKAMWDQWATRFQKKKHYTAAASYDFGGVRTRLKELGLLDGSRNEHRLLSLGRTGPCGLLAVGFAYDLGKWAKTYEPPVKFGDPMPSKVRLYMVSRCLNPLASPPFIEVARYLASRLFRR